jgi:hypothetical protein
MARRTSSHSVVVDDLDVMSIAVEPAKTDTPLIVDPYDSAFSE